MPNLNNYNSGVVASNGLVAGHNNLTGGAGNELKIVKKTSRDIPLVGEGGKKVDVLGEGKGMGD